MLPQYDSRKADLPKRSEYVGALSWLKAVQNRIGEPVVFALDEALMCQGSFTLSFDAGGGSGSMKSNEAHPGKTGCAFVVNRFLKKKIVMLLVFRRRLCYNIEQNKKGGAFV